MAQKPIRNRIEFGDNLNPLNDYGGGGGGFHLLMMMEIYKQLLIKLIK